nr:EAL domain-containing protein [Marinobacter adhaerens]
MTEYRTISSIELSVLEAQQYIHELIAQKQPLEQILDAIADWVGSMLPRGLVSIMELHPTTHTLRLIPSNRFPDHFCWSMPIRTSREEVLGSFSVYYRAPVTPMAGAQRHLKQGAALAALAILRHREVEEHRTLSVWHRTLFDDHPYGVYTFDLDGHFQSCNKALERITGYSAASLHNLHFNLFIEPYYHSQTQAAFNKARNGETTTYETMGTHASGAPYYLEITNFPVTIEGEIVGVYGLCRDITDRKHQEAKIAYQASHDLLTGLLNEPSFQEKLYETVVTRGRSGAVAALYLDLDGFKPINDEMGHHAGNQVLKTTAGRLKDLTAPDMIVARLVGDEFGILIPGYRSRNDVIQLAEQILERLAQPIDVAGQMIHISTSIGIASISSSLEEPCELLQFADIAREQAKRQGKNTWQWYDCQNAERSFNSVNLRHELHIALKESQFELYYQPLVDAVTGRICSVEALVRWRHPVRGLVSPGDFIPLAEQTGQIIPLGLWVLEQACIEIADLNTQRERALCVAVNISSLQFIRDGFLDDVRQVLAKTGLSPELLELEVTESVLLKGVGSVIDLMTTLKTLGVRVALDDFGTGFSSLSYLRDLPSHKVKLDRSFVEKIRTDRRIAAIVQSVITMAHQMGMVVVAEGIETQEQREDLARRHCDILQGYLFARPMPLAELKKLPDFLPGAQRY